MAIQIAQDVADFLRDAQFRIAEIGTSLDGMGDFESPEYKELEEQRLELYQFMDCLYVGQWSIYESDGFNHLDWDDYDINQEMEYLRNRTGMITSPFTAFVGNYPEIVGNIDGQDASGGALPTGIEGQYVGYDVNGVPIAIGFPILAGANDIDTALTYFA